MKAKILLISTRWIHEPNSIFSNAERGDPNSSLKEYFYNVSNEDLRKALENKLKSQNQQDIMSTPTKGEPMSINEVKANEIWNKLPLWLQNDTTLTTLYANDDYSSFIKQLYDKLLLYIDNKEYEDQIDKCNLIIEVIRPFLKDEQVNSKEKELPSFIFTTTKDDFADCLDCKAINIDQSESVGLTIADRLSLYKVEMYDDNENNEHVKFLVYAIWPLGNPNKDKSNGKEQDSVSWVNQLTKAISEECKDYDRIELILLLHDNDMLSTAKTPLKTLEIDSSVLPEQAQEIKRTVAVYQHSNINFIALATQKNQNNAKIIYESARNFIVDDLIIQQLAKLSNLLATYTGQEDNNNIKIQIDWLNKYIKKEHDSKGYLNALGKLYSYSCISIQLSSDILIESNYCVNNLIKEIVTPEK